jgi:hypothetical protein
MRKLYIERQKPLYLPWYRRSWSWWYVAFGDFQPFKRFGHGGWVCLSVSWLKRFWNGAGPRPECCQ